MGSVSALSERTVLIVEDETLIALDIAQEFSAHGAHAVMVSTVEQALGALAKAKFAVAIVDHRLGREDASEVIQRLAKLQIPFVIHSGYDEVAAWANAPVVHKPALRQHLIQTVSDLLG